jgi:drug/metabolite transporter (DMT)-like permease
MILVAFIYSITSNLGKICIKHSSPIFFAIFYMILLTIFFLPFIRIKSHIKLKDIFNKFYIFIAIGFFSALVFIFHNLALDQTSVAYMISLKRTNIIFSVIIGALFFKERDFKNRLLGSIVMLFGVTLISI